MGFQIIAGAGSGKTRTIVYSVAKLLVSGVKPSQIMLVTFTNKAAHEMIKRVEILLGKKPKGIWGGTFHSIANRFLRMYAKTLGLKPNFTIMDETDAKGLMKLSIDKAGVKDLEERFPTAAMVKAILSFSIKIFGAISKTDDPIINVSSSAFIAKQLRGSRISKDGIKNLISHTKNLKGFTVDDAPAELVKKLIGALEDHIKAKYDNWQDRLEDLHQLGVYAQSYPTTQKFLENLSLNASSLESRTTKMGSQTEDEKPIVLSTVHRAKGLEWRVVFIPMLCEDSFPSSRAIGDADAYEEERRVFYVATTRTKDELYLISPAVRNTYRGPQTVRVSQFVEELNPKVYKRSTVRYKPTIKKNKTLKENKVSFFTTADKLEKK